MMLLFIVSVLAFLYTFAGYPLLLKILTRNKYDIIASTASGEPEISIVLCIYNSADKLHQRISNIYESDYPTSKIHLIVVSDGSTDDPKAVIDQIPNHNISLIEYQKNRGKSYALNQGLAIVNTELVAFTDVRQSFDPIALKNLIRHFDDEEVGAVSGNLEIKSNEDSKASDPGLYWKYEKWIRKNESELDSMLGVTGAIYMARRALIPAIPNDALLDDMFVPLTMVGKGYKIKFDEAAIAYDISSGSTSEEFHRKVRTLAGNFQLMAQLPWLLSPRKNPLFFQFFSHKVMRLVMPYFLLIVLGTSFSIEHLAFQALFFLQLAFYGYSLLSYVLLKRDVKIPLASICTSFCSLHLASLIAGWKYQFSSAQSLWKKH